MTRVEIPLTHKIGEPNVNRVIFTKESYLKAFKKITDCGAGIPIIFGEDTDFMEKGLKATTTDISIMIGCAMNIKDDDITIECNMIKVPYVDFDKNDYVLCTNCIADHIRGLEYDVKYIKSFSLYPKKDIKK